MKTMSATVLSGVATLLLVGSASALDLAGFEITGYSRGGPVFVYDKDTGVKGNFTLGGDLHKFRLGNEGDNGFEINIARTAEIGGAQVKFDYMPTKWNSGDLGTEQAYVEISNLEFAPKVAVWAGQRRGRINDIHIVDHFLLNYSLGEGIGIEHLRIGGAEMALAFINGATIDNPLPAGVNANRVNAHLADFPVNPGGKLNVLLTGVHGSGLGSTDNDGWGIAVSHTQNDLGIKGVSNTVWVQTASGHANVDGGFLNLDEVSGGATTRRIADAVTWQIGAFGGQAMVGYQSGESDLTGVDTDDFSLGGRVGYAFSRNFKLLLEAATTTRRVEGQDEQHLHKLTIAPTLALAEDFWARPELRFYLTLADWNTAAATANAATFGSGGKTSQTLAGVQYEIWW